MPTVILLAYGDDLPSHFVEVTCEACGVPGWLSPEQAMIPGVEFVCGDCYWFLFLEDFLGPPPGE